VGGNNWLHRSFLYLIKKKTDLLEIINSIKPDIIIGTETWLDKSIPSTDYFPNLDVSYGLQLYQAVGGVVLHLVFQL
jgi:hypothetical protein